MTQPVYAALTITDYYYLKNIQGDILRIYDDSGVLYAEYSYDAWGKCTIKSNTDNIANINPFRYRGYYYDEETSLYYLNARYYDPEVGRFISADTVEYLNPAAINGLNLYAYCNNNPIMYTDPYGTTAWWEWLIAGVVTAFAVAGAVFVTITTGGLAASIVTGMAIGAVVSLATQYEDGELDWAQFGIDSLIGALSGAFSYGIGQIAKYGGQIASLWIGNSFINGFKVNKIVSQSVISTLMEKGGEIFGGFVGGMFYDKHINMLLKTNNSFGERFKNNLGGTMASSLLDFIRYLWKIA